MLEAFLDALGIESIVPIFNGLAIAAAALVTLLGFYLSRRGAIRAEQSKNAYELVSIFENERFRANFDCLKPYLNNDTRLPGFDEIDLFAKKNLTSLLLEMEKVSVAVRRGYLSEDYIAQTAKTGVVKLFRAAATYIVTAREKTRSPTFYENYEMLVVRFAVSPRGLIIGALEWILARPLFSLSRVKFCIDHWICCRLYADLERNWMIADWNLVVNAHARLRRLKMFVILLGIILYAFAAWSIDPST